jgi:hypothetical protein
MASRRGAVISTSIFSDLVDAGLNGIEVDHRDQTAAERVELRKVAQELELVITGASDYHGTGKMNSLGENLTDPAQWERLESLASHRRVVTP